jgi:Pyruvate/2-oxoacid:ferredoxin oxidoreductase delta subunit
LVNQHLATKKVSLILKITRQSCIKCFFCYSHCPRNRFKHKVIGLT